MSTIKTCVKDEQLKGATVTVMTEVASSGSVKSVKPSSSKLRKSSDKTCILNAVKRMKFPAFSSDTLKFPLTLKL